MQWLQLPPPNSTRTADFNDIPSAKAWLAGQPQAQPLLMLTALGGAAGQRLVVQAAEDLPPLERGER